MPSRAGHGCFLCVYKGGSTQVNDGDRSSMKLNLPKRRKKKNISVARYEPGNLCVSVCLEFFATETETDVIKTEKENEGRKAVGRKKCSFPEHRSAVDFVVFFVLFLLFVLLFVVRSSSPPHPTPSPHRSSHQKKNRTIPLYLIDDLYEDLYDAVNEKQRKRGV
eukprot:gene6994-4958_t